MGKYLSKLLNPLTHNQYTVKKDSFNADGKIEIPKTLLDEGYSLVSFDAVSLSTNVPLQRTINIIQRHIYNEKMVDTTLKKNTLKKLIGDTCTKTVFSCNNTLYEQTDGVSIGSSLAPVLANIILTELENKIVNKLVDEGIIKFYIRYVDDTLLLLKREDIDRVHKAFESWRTLLQASVTRSWRLKLEAIAVLI